MNFPRALRLLLGLAAALIILWAFVDVGARWWRGSAAGAGAAGFATSPSTQAPAARLRVVHWGDNEEIEIIEAMLAEFRGEHPHIAVERIHAADYWPKVKTMFASGDPPDLFYLEPQYVPELVDLGLVLSIDELVESAGGYDAVLGDYYEAPLNAFRYDGHRLGAGRLYGIPKDFTTSVMYVNLDLFKRAGLRVPYEGWTWNEYEEALRTISALSTPRNKVWGGMLVTEPAFLLNILWTFGGDFFAVDEQGFADYRDVTLDSPQSQTALSMLRRMRIEERTLYNPSGISEDAETLFVRGDMGSIGPIGRWRTPLFRKAAEAQGLEFDVVPVPHAPGHPSASQIYTTAYAISASTRHPKEAFELQRFLTGPAGARVSARMGLAIPPMRSVAQSEAFLDPSLPPANARLFLDTVETSQLQQFPLYYSQFDRLMKNAAEAALHVGEASPQQVAGEVEQKWLAIVDSPLRKEYPPMRWAAIASIVAGILALGLVLVWMRARQQRLGALDRAQERAGFAFIAPWLIGFALFTAFPMFMSLLLAFTRWTAMTSLDRAAFVGPTNFAVLLSEDASFWRSLWVTGYYVLLAVPVTQVAALAVALLMNARARGIGVFRTIYFVPSVVSGVALAVLWLKLFNRDYGLINWLLSPIRWIGLWPPDWFGADAAWAAVPAFVLMTLWGVGGGMVIYLAGLKGIPGSLYEAATIDGAGPWRRLWNITIPMLSPLIFFNVVMGVIASFQIFTQAKVMTDGGPNDATLFYVLNLYRSAFEFHEMGYASAMAWILFVIILALTALIFRGSRGLVHYEGLKA
jgi:multiple sugar transport system permease protein